MRNVLLGTGLVAAAITASANAAFLGFGARSDTVTVGANTYTRIDVYAMFDGANDKLLSVFDANISLVGATQYYQSGSGALRSWDVSAQFDSETGTFFNNADSFVTIGASSPQFDSDLGEWFNANPVNPDPNFTSTSWQGAGSLGAIPVLAGWFNPNPNGNEFGIHNQAVAVSGLTDNPSGGTLGVMVGRFSVLGIPADTSSRLLNFNAKVKWNLIGQSGSQDGQDSQVFKYVPAPGALALLGLAGLAGRRRRA